MNENQTGTNQTSAELQAIQNDLLAKQSQIEAFKNKYAAHKAISDKFSSLQKNIDNLAKIGIRPNGSGPLSEDMRVKIAEAGELKRSLDAQSIELQQTRDRLSNAGISTSELGEHNRVLNERIRQSNEALRNHHDHLERIERRNRSIQSLDRRAGALEMVGVAHEASKNTVETGQAGFSGINKTIQAYSAQEQAFIRLENAMKLGLNTGDSGSDFESNQAKLKEFNQLKKILRQLSETYQFDAIQVADSITKMKLQGVEFKSDKDYQSIESVIQYALISKQSPENSVDAILKAKDYLSEEDATIPIIAELLKSTTSVDLAQDDLISFLAGMSPFMAKNKAVFEKDRGAFAETTFVMAALAATFDQMGLKGNAGGLALNQVIASTMNADRLANANEQLGGGQKLEFLDKNGDFIGLRAAVDQFKLLSEKNVTPAQTQAFFKALIGPQADSAQLKVLNALVYKQEDLSENAEKIYSQNSLEKMAHRSDDSIDATQAKLGNAFGNLLGEIGSTLRPEIMGVTLWLKDFIGGIREWVEQHPQLTRFVVALVAAGSILFIVIGTIGAVLMAILAPLLLVSMIAPLLGVGLAGVAAALAPIALTLLAIVAIFFAVVGAAWLVYEHWAGIKKFFGFGDDKDKQKTETNAAAGKLQDLKGISNLPSIDSVTKSQVIDANSDVSLLKAVGTQSSLSVKPESSPKTPVSFEEVTTVKTLNDQTKPLQQQLTQCCCELPASAGDKSQSMNELEQNSGWKNLLPTFATCALAMPFPFMPGLLMQDLSGFGTKEFSFDQRPALAQEGGGVAHKATGDTIQIIVNPPIGSDAHLIAHTISAALEKSARNKRSGLSSSLHD